MKDSSPSASPISSVDDYVPWIAERKGETFASRLKKKMGDNVLFALGATIQAMQCDAKLEAIAKELDEACHVYVGSGVGDLPQSYQAARTLDRATRAWLHFWADPRAARRGRPGRRAARSTDRRLRSTPPRFRSTAKNASTRASRGTPTGRNAPRV